MTECKRAVAYVRVSSASQVEGYSLDAQERLFTELCKNRDWQSVRIYREEGKSAHVDSIHKRPVFRKLLEDAAKDEFDVVVVHTLDRWSRNLTVTLESLKILGRYGIGLVSIVENLDYSKPDGILFTQMLGAFAQYFSEALSTHVRKGLDQRAYEGKHNGCIPFGYESCWELGEKGEKKRHCLVEHQGGIHIHPIERQAAEGLFRRYSVGTTTLSQLAAWLNEQGFRTRNTKNLPDANGNLVSGPRLFTSSSVRNILHNPFYAGQITHRGKLMPGAHEALISQELFDLVQLTLRKNSGRSETLKALPEREYLLKGLARCAYCGMPMWAQTYHNGGRYYREHRASRSIEQCVAHGGTIPCEVVDRQMIELVSAIELKESWLEEVLSVISLKDEVDRVTKEREQVNIKLKRMAKAYIDGLISDDEYNRQKKVYGLALESLVVSDYNASEEAGKLIMNLLSLWDKATLSEQRKLLLTMLDAVYIDFKKSKSIIAVKPKPPFKPIFQVAVSKKDSKIRILNEPFGKGPIGSSLFLVETGEGWTLPETMVMGFAGC
ncbi:MAG: serine recombinase [Dehalococcoides mccartyi]|uniref:recombinase family protein n=1 Tax=Dehalococcoides mccartyi TaxID=61435 RepID=UPI000805A504|nr:recombinase family protein [Dehalococcoides mccartyi]OBW62403.1 MAG: serine recombinase [Dehalococcoides mccartyi]